MIEVAGITRHIQLKSSRIGAKASDQKVNARLMTKPSGCVIWIRFDPGTIILGPFHWYGAEPGKPLPDITGFKPARHTKADANGVKSLRRNTYCIPISRFDRLNDMDALASKLFGPSVSVGSGADAATLS